MNRAIDEVEIVNEHIKIEWMYDRRLVVFHVTSIKKQALDTWADKMREMMLACPEPTFYTLHNYTGVANFITTPYLRQRSKELSQLRPDLNTRTAICIPKSVLAQVTLVFVKALPKHHRVDRVRELFFTFEEGLTWIEAQMAEESRHP